MEVTDLKPIALRSKGRLTGKWIVDQRNLSIPGGRPEFQTKHEAQEFIDNLIRTSNKKLSTASHWRVIDLWEKFEKDCIEDPIFAAQGKNKNLKNKFRDIVSILDIKVGSHKFKNILVREVDTVMYKDYIIPSISQNASTKTAQNKHNSINLMFDEAVGYGCRLDNPLREKCLKVAGTKISKEQIAPEDIHSEEILKIINSAKNLYWKSAMSFAAFTGLRQGEQRALTWGDLNLDDGPKVRVSKRVVREKEYNMIDGKSVVYNSTYVKKGTKGGDLRSKTKGGDKRFVPLSTELVSLLKEYKLSCKRSEPTDYVWASQTGHFISHTRCGEELRATIKRANVNPIHWHIFRHYYASMLFLRYSEDVSKITKWMGHADEAVTKKVYRHWLETEDQQAEDQSNIDTLYSLKAPIKMTGTDDGFYPE